MTRRWVPACCALIISAACGGGKIKNTGQAPQASFTATESTVRPQVFHFDASASFSVVGTIVKYQWIFGDENGGPATDEQAAVTLHAYTATGTYTVTLVVFDDSGTQSEPTTQKVTVPSVNNALPVAKITGPALGNPGQALTFDGSGSTPANDIQQYAWNFGDPSSNANNTFAGPTATMATHTFATAGQYSVTLEVTDSLGQNDTAEVIVGIGNSGPIAVCTFMPAQPMEGSPVDFDGTQSASPGAAITTWVWNFGDGSNGAGSTVQHTYNVVATFHPTLQVIDSNNKASAMASCPAVVIQAPMACVGSYTLTANPTTETCLTPGDTTWVGVQWTMTEMAGGSITATEANGPSADGGSATIVYTGTWSGSTFNMTGTYSYPDGNGGTITSNATISGNFSGCATWSGTWMEDDTDYNDCVCGLLSGSSPCHLCNITWNVSGTKI
jgi:PKD repeat protein